MMSWALTTTAGNTMQPASHTLQLQAKLVFYVNGKKVVENNPNPEELLGKYLRNELRLVGTKKACGQGGCGACTVMVSRIDRQRKIHHYAINSCITPICSLHGLAITTVEGIGSRHGNIHPVQEQLALSHGTQCGFCSPGMVMSMYALLRSNPLPSVAQIERALEGNLCRCTGYRPIMDGFRTFTKEAQCAMGDGCCKLQKKDDPTSSKTSESEKESSEYLPYHSTQEPIFPSELQLSALLDKESLMFTSQKVTWYRPTTLRQLLELRTTHPNAKLIGGNYEQIVGFGRHHKVIIDPSKVPEMKEIQLTDQGVVFGSSVTLSEMEEALQETIDQLPEYKTRLFNSLLVKLGSVGSLQLRNSATLGGHIMTASSSSDLNTQFLASRSRVTVATHDGAQQQIAMDEAFFVACGEIVLQPHDILLSLLLPYSTQREYMEGFKLHKAASRKEEIVCVNAAMRVVFQEDTDVIQDIALSFGGIRSTSMLAANSQNKLIGRAWDDTLVTVTSDLLTSEIQPTAGGQSDTDDYKQTLAVSLFFKFYLSVQVKLRAAQQTSTDVETMRCDSSATTPLPRASARGIQVYEEVPTNQSSFDAVGRALPVKSALNNALGKSVFIGDMPPYQGELYVALITSTEAHAKIISVAPSRALQMAGVVDFITAADVPGSNLSGAVERTEEIFATEEVLCRGQTIGAIVARSQTEALEAASAVQVEYEPLPAIISIQQAIDAGSFFNDAERTLTNGNVTAGFGTSDQVIEGETYMGAQEHFYMEPHSCVAIPRGEEGEMEVFSSTQAPSSVQTGVAEALGVSSNKIVCRVKRVGGAFGGKATRWMLVALPAAVAAHKLQRPVRCILERSTDMAISGQRRPVLAKYKVGCTNDGRILAIDIIFYVNSGCTVEIVPEFNETFILFMDNGYKIPNLRVHAQACRTNLPTFTAFRGFGRPQGQFIIQTVLQHIAETLKLPPEQVCELNLYRDGDVTPYNEVLEDCHVRQCWQDVLQRSDYETRRAQVDTFNREHQWKKRGLATVPQKFGMSLAGASTFLNQAGALVHVYTDGTVLVTHGGCELGQGLHTKMIQVTSRALGIPIEKIHISETSTNTVPNTSGTDSSITSDVNGMAIANACQILTERLEPYKMAAPEDGWDKWVLAAYFDRVSLSATGFYKIPGLNYDWKTNSGRAHLYYTYGACCSEVEIDCLTGDHVVLRSDIVMDVGRSLNPGVDIGQIEGSFMQGYGLFVLEEVKWSDEGRLCTNCPGTYQIPRFSDIPSEFNVSLLRGMSNPHAIYSSKGIGEPALFLASSVFFAVKNAIMAARRQVGLDEPFRLDSPATPEKIRMACVDQFTKKLNDCATGPIFSKKQISYVRSCANMADYFFAAKFRKLVFSKRLRIFAAKKFATCVRKSREGLLALQRIRSLIFCYVLPF